MKQRNRRSESHIRLIVFIRVVLCVAFGVLLFTSFSALFLQENNAVEPPALPVNTFNQSIRNRNQEVFEEYSKKHVLIKSYNQPVTCAAKNMQLLRGEILPENYKYEMILMMKQDPQYYSLCLGDDSHQYTIEFSLEYGQCDILVSASGALPRPDYWDWKLNSRLNRKSLAIHTFSPELLRSTDKNLHIGFVSNIGGACKVGVKISLFSDEELLPKLGLRGGQVMLRRDIIH